jgi:hypothetical protein
MADDHVAESLRVPLNGNLRDQFATAALTGMLAKDSDRGVFTDPNDRAQWAEVAYEYAAAMLLARKAGKE